MRKAMMPAAARMLISAQSQPSFLFLPLFFCFFNERAVAFVTAYFLLKPFQDETIGIVLGAGAGLDNLKLLHQILCIRQSAQEFFHILICQVPVGLTVGIFLDALGGHLGIGINLQIFAPQLKLVSAKDVGFLLECFGDLSLSLAHKHNTLLHNKPLSAVMAFASVATLIFVGVLCSPVVP